MCYALLLEVIHNYMNNNSSLIIVDLDASKAFERLCDSKLFNLLLKRNVRPFTLRFVNNIIYIGTLKC